MEGRRGLRDARNRQSVGPPFAVPLSAGSGVEAFQGYRAMPLGSYPSFPLPASSMISGGYPCSLTPPGGGVPFSTDVVVVVVPSHVPPLKNHGARRLRRDPWVLV
jgi:hypothetical protein